MDRLPGIHHRFPVIEEMPRPDWAMIFQWIGDNLLADQFAEAHDEIVCQWLDELAAMLGSTHNAFQSEDLILLSFLDRREAIGLIRFAEKARGLIRSLLPYAFETRGAGSTVVLHFEDPDEYWRYAAYFHSDGGFGQSAGMCIGGEFTHIVLADAPGDQLQMCMGHELVHESLSHLGLPQWIEEGLAQLVEQKFFPYAHFRDVADLRRNFAVLTERNIQSFWNGEGFSSEQTLQEACYVFALSLVGRLVEEFVTIDDFVANASREDHGAATASDHLGTTLGELAAGILGNGSWEPRAFD